MTARYDLRTQDQDAGSYAALPGTAQTEFVQHNMTPMKSRLTPGKEVPGTPCPSGRPQDRSPY